MWTQVLFLWHHCPWGNCCVILGAVWSVLHLFILVSKLWIMSFSTSVSPLGIGTTFSFSNSDECAVLSHRAWTFIFLVVKTMNNLCVLTCHPSSLSSLLCILRVLLRFEMLCLHSRALPIFWRLVFVTHMHSKYFLLFCTLSFILYRTNMVNFNMVWSTKFIF